MSKLLRANFARLWKRKIFWICAAAMVVYAAITLIEAANIDSSSPGQSTPLDQLFFAITPLTGLFCSVFIGLFLGTEYSDGAMRNKLIVGHTRGGIYFANLLTCTVASLLFTAVFFLVMLAVGVPMFGWLQNGAPAILSYLLVSVLMVAAFASIFTLLAMLIQNRAISSVLSILVFFGLLFLASYLNLRLAEPEMYSGMMMSVDGMVISEPQPNPQYLTGTVRQVYTFFLDFLPTGQGLQLVNWEATHIWQMCLYSLFITITTTACGLLSFRRKDIK